MNFLGSFLSQIKPTYDDNAVDRLHYYWTCRITILLALTIGLYQFGGNPVTCWAPAQFTGFWEQYVVDYCFVENTYWLPWRNNIPDGVEVRKDKEITYYQWIPFILALMAFFFYLPHLFWNMLNGQSGISVGQIVSMGQDVKNVKAGDREQSRKVIASHIDKAISIQRDYGGKGNPLGVCLQYGKHYGIYVSGLYILIKILAIANVVGQFFMLNEFLSPKYRWWGVGVMQDLVNGTEWENSGHFPRVTMCDFKVRVLGNLHNWTVQCVIWINMLNEKIFLFLWFWMFLVAFLSICDFVYWVITIASPKHSRHFLKQYLRARGLIKPNYSNEDAKMIAKFMKRLRPDGILVLRIMSTNVGDLLTSDIVCDLYQRHLERAKTFPSPGSFGSTPLSADEKAPLMAPITAFAHPEFAEIDTIDENSPSPPTNRFPPPYNGNHPTREYSA